MKNSIKIKAVEKQIPIFEIEITNGIVTLSIDILDNPDRLKEFGRQLVDYPLQPSIGTGNFKATLLYRGYSQLQSWKHYFDRFTVDVHTYKTNGDAAITVTLQDKKDYLLGNTVHFSILTHAAYIVELGEKLLQWDPGMENDLIWEAD